MKHLPEAVNLLHDDPDLRQLSANARQSVIDRYASDAVAATALRHGANGDGVPRQKSLIKKLRDDPGFITSVDSAEMQKNLRNAVGCPAAGELLQMRLIHSPAVQRIYNYVYRKLHRQ